MREAIHQIRLTALTRDAKPKMVATANAQFAQLAMSNRRFRNILRDAELVVADGMSVVMAARLLGQSLPERIAGIDLMSELCGDAETAGLSVYFLGGRPGAAKKASENLRARFTRLKVAGIDCPRPGFENDASESDAVVRRIAQAAPDILFVGFGAPKQEYWMEDHASALPVKVMIGVGCSFDVLSGELARAPQGMQRVGMEWVFRLGQEPKRLWRRYLVGNAQFVKAVLWQWLTERKESWLAS
ncbi:MAG TPA: WecB/TagA/CpsF family glycosyltransferase [Terracidiphilus sp.]|nr:WecB/TagA/CpsF family glycosyltransferase [Terracidiphilus sp.]